MSNDPAYGLGEIARYLRQMGVQRWCYVDEAERYHGLSRAELTQICRSATLLFSSASTTWVEEFRECRTRVYFDIDPGFTQFRMPATPTPSCPGYASPYDFNFHFTIGEHIGKPACMIPTHGLNWRFMRNPVALDLVPVRFTPDASRFTTVMSWTAYGSTEYDGIRYGQKDVELTKFLNLPQRTGSILEIALGGQRAPADELRAAGWVVSDALQATLTVDSYRDFIGRSRGEFSVAKEAYVKTRCGWFSDRTAAYLAAGKPAIVQDTGFSESLPCGEGLFAFHTVDDVVAALAAIDGDYAKHCRAARRIAEEYFDSTKVLGSLLQTCELPGRVC